MAKAESISRRSVLAAAGGAAVAVGLTGARSAKANPTSDEIDAWVKRIGTTFRCRPDTRDRKQSTVTMTLVNVHACDFNDPARPSHMRTPFSLVFLPDGERQDFQSRSFIVSGRKGERLKMMLSEAMDMDLGVLVIEAVFG